jgi:hypothetical protein
MAGVDNSGNITSHEAAGHRCGGSGSLARNPEADALVSSHHSDRQQRREPEIPASSFGYELTLYNWVMYSGERTYTYRGETWKVPNDSISVPFERLMEKRRQVENRERVSNQSSYSYYGDGGSSGSIRAVNAGLFNPR